MKAVVDLTVIGDYFRKLETSAREIAREAEWNTFHGSRSSRRDALAEFAIYEGRAGAYKTAAEFIEGLEKKAEELRKQALLPDPTPYGRTVWSNE